MPDRNPIPKLHFRLRTPDRRRIQSVKLNGKTFDAFDPKTETLDLTGQRGMIKLEVRFS